MDNYWALATLPIIGAVIGWATNYLAVKMIFRPKKPVRILGLTFWGLLPRRQEDLARSVAQTVSEDLLGVEDIASQLSQSVKSESLIQKIESAIVSELGKNPLFAGLLQSEKGEQMRTMISSQVKGIIPTIKRAAVKPFLDRLDIESMIFDKVSQFELDKLESIVYRISAKELKSIEILGGILGFMVGVLQIGFLAMSM